MTAHPEDRDSEDVRRLALGARGSAMTAMVLRWSAVLAPACILKG